MSQPNCRTLAATLNADCVCRTLDRDRLHAELNQEAPGFWEGVIAARPHLFSEVTLYAGARDLRRMAEVIAAIERVVALPAYREHVGIAAGPFREPQAKSVFFGYDFHLGEQGPQLIEINTNAGGALLNAVLARAQRVCCEDWRAELPGEIGRRPPEELFVEMFRNEWRLERGDVPLKTVAIVDDDPANQYLQPEFELFRRLFERHGIQAVICDPRDLMSCHGGLWHEETRIDLVYNRLTDFDLSEDAHVILRDAALSRSAVVTPHPYAHALYADKRNLCALTDAALLASWGVDAATRELLLAGIPRTERVTAAAAADLWVRRKGLFFKPAAGYGSKAAYRGDKITKRVFEEVLQGDYVAQALVPPSSRQVEVDGNLTELKVDLRNYVYAGAVQLVAARLWQGQTTNFRTPGGGFAPVLGVRVAEQSQ